MFQCLLSFLTLLHVSHTCFLPCLLRLVLLWAGGVGLFELLMCKYVFSFRKDAKEGNLVVNNR